MNFQIKGSEAVEFAAVPTLAFKLHILHASHEQVIHNIMLHCQIQIEATRRRYSATEQDRLFDLYGEPQRWGQTLRPMLWTHASVIVPAFKDHTAVDLLVPCTFDFNVAATKYFAALAEGEVPLCFLFSGTIFYENEDNAMQVMQIPWEKESTYRLPVPVWQKMMDIYYPNQNWLMLRRDVFDRLDAYKRQKGIPSWEQALDKLLDAASQPEEKAIAAQKSS